VAGLSAIGGDGDGEKARSGILPRSVEFNLPVETRVERREERWVLLADSPQTRTRTPFDLPFGRISAVIGVERAP